MTIEATSSTQWAAADGGPISSLEPVVSGVWSLPMAMPGGPSLPYSLCYLLVDGDGGVHIVDPGWDDPNNVDRLDDALHGIGRRWTDVVTIVATHAHPDHVGSVERIRARAAHAQYLVHRAELGAERHGSAGSGPSPQLERDLDRWNVPVGARGELLASRPRANGPPRPVADRVLDDADVLPVPGSTVRVLHTPGHTAGSLCLHIVEPHLLITGDHLLPVIHPGIGLGVEPDRRALEQYFDSLLRIRALGDPEVLPGHGFRFRGLAERALDTAHHHLRRANEVKVALAAGQRSTWDIASVLTWTAGWHRLWPFTRISALRQTEMHIDLVRSGRLASIEAMWSRQPEPTAPSALQP